ncbi:MAG: Arginyl-tRNA--protein transferase 1 [Sclerophora amabilis]|nr:MAG: Arginyl-tRNA--protein transferase 1 [Sclerophora amabilis]
MLGEKYASEAATLYPVSKENKARRKTEFNLIEAVHGSEYSQLRTPPEPDHKFEVILEEDRFTEEKYLLYSDYQQKVHKDPPSKINRDSFSRFLCSSPLKHRTQKDGVREQKLGSYHQCYRIDGRLVAFGVLDLLPQCVSAVYFIGSYHENMNKWNFGKISALREAALADEAGYKYYYMDPESYTWDPLDSDFRHKLDIRKYVSLSQDRHRGKQITPSSMPISAQNNNDGKSRSEIRNTSPNLPTAGQPPGEGAAATAEGQHEQEKRRNSLDGVTSSDSELSDDEEYVGVSLFDAQMPGVLTREEVTELIDLDEIRVKVRRQFAKAKVRGMKPLSST